MNELIELNKTIPDIEIIGNLEIKNCETIINQFN